MISIIILGAGRSTSSLIEYLATHADNLKWSITVIDMDKKSIHEKCNSFDNVKGVCDDLKNQETLKKWICEGDIIVSMLPAFMHPFVAQVCLKNNKPFYSISYIVYSS